MSLRVRSGDLGGPYVDHKVIGLAATNPTANENFIEVMMNILMCQLGGTSSWKLERFPLSFDVH